MLCGGHAGRAHRKTPEATISPYVFPVIHMYIYARSIVYIMYVGKHRSGCGCLTDTFISKAHTNFTSILAKSQDEFVRRVKALPRHAVDDHSQCDYHCVPVVHVRTGTR